MNNIKDYLRPHRNLEAEKQLKAIIQEIQLLMYEPKNSSTVKNLLKEAAKFIKTPDRVLDVIVIEQYEEWTDLDGLVGELTMEVPRLDAISKEDFSSIVQWIKDAIHNEQETDHMRLDYWMEFYRIFFAQNFPNVNDVDLLDEIFEDSSFDELVALAFPDA